MDKQPQTRAEEAWLPTYSEGLSARLSPPVYIHSIYFSTKGGEKGEKHKNILSTKNNQVPSVLIYMPAYELTTQLVRERIMYIHPVLVIFQWLFTSQVL